MKLPTAHNRDVTAVAALNEEQLVSCGVDGTVQVWDVRRPVPQIKVT